MPAGALYWYPSDRETFTRRVESEGELRNEEYVLRRKDGTMLVVVDNCRVVRDSHGRVSGYEGTLTDITERKKAETAVFQAKERAQVTLQSIGDAVITTDSEGRIDYMNPVAESLTGWENREAQRPAHRRCADRGRRDDATAARKPGHALPARRTGAGPRRTHGPGEPPRPGNRHPGFGGADPRPRRQSDRRRHGVPRRQQGAAPAPRAALPGEPRCAHRAHQPARVREPPYRRGRRVRGRNAAARHALLYLDLDQFKLVNDTCGHPAGDQLLKQITGVLQSRVRGGDTLARLGGDEFGILLQSCSLDQALRIAESLRQAIRDYRFIWQDGVLEVGVSIGIVEITRETPTVANVMSAADVACYSAKDSGPQSRAAVQARRRAGAASRDALGLQAARAPATKAASNCSISRSCRSAQPRRSASTSS